MKPLDAERVALLDALGRVLAEDATSDIDVAPFDNSAMDGYAVRAADLAGASEDTPVELDVVAHIAAGDWWDGEVGPGQAARIMTGSPVPAGADSIVMVESHAPSPATVASARGSRWRASRSSASTSAAAARRCSPATWSSRRATCSARRRSGCSPRPATTPSPSTAVRASRSLDRQRARRGRREARPRQDPQLQQLLDRRAGARRRRRLRSATASCPTTWMRRASRFRACRERMRLHRHERGRLGGRLRLREAGARGDRRD